VVRNAPTQDDSVMGASPPPAPKQTLMCTKLYCLHVAQRLL